MQGFLVFLAGLVFGMGLILSGMADPARVLGFLDLSGSWDPSLALVMGGAIMVGFFAFQTAQKRTHTLIGNVMRLPSRATAIDKRLVFGSTVFGAGWGLAGFCPGPAIVAMGSGYPKAVAFVAAMLAGMFVFELTDRYARRQRKASNTTGS